MYLALGVGVLSAAALLFAWAYAAHRRPVPARWTGREFLSSGICLIVTGLVPIGGGYLVVALIDPLATVRSLDAVSLGAIVLSAALAWLLIPRLLQSVSPTANAPGMAPPRSPNRGPTSGTRQPASARRAAKRAA